MRVVIDGVEYAPVEKKEPGPKTGRYLKVDLNPLLHISSYSPGFKFREDLKTNWMPDIVDADGEKIGYVVITEGEVSVGE